MSTNRKHDHRIHSLPNEILLEIFKYIAPTDLIQNLSVVSRRWRALALDPAVWQRKTIQDNDIRDNLKTLYFAPILHEVNITTSNPNSVYEALNHGHKDVKKLSVRFSKNRFSVTQICDLIQRFPNLTKLSIPIPVAIGQNVDIFRALRSLSKLQELTLSGVISDTQELVELVAHCKSLKKLNVSECQMVLRDRHLAGISRDRAWHSLQLVTHFITENGYKMIGDCRSLSDLALVKCRNLSFLALQHLTALTELRAVSIKENWVLSASALTTFFHTDTMERLIKVDLTVYRADDDVALTIATRCTNLMHLRLAACVLTDRGVRDIVLNAANLTHLDLEFNNIRGDALPLIPKHLQNLKYLNLHLCYNVHINLPLLAQALPNFTIVDPTGLAISAATFAFDTITTIYT